MEALPIVGMSRPLFRGFRILDTRDGWDHGSICMF